MKKSHFFLVLLVITSAILACNAGNKEQKTDSRSGAASFDMQKARAFIDSINTKWVEELKKGDSASIASHYGPDAKILLPNGEPIQGKDILSTWGGIIRSGLTDWKFATTDLEGNSDYLVETGTYEINDANKKLVDKGNYLVIWKQQNGEWKLYRDVGVTSLPATGSK